jgi:uncharacterized Fe-S radical SAM superfamily protein PflX
MKKGKKKPKQKRIQKLSTSKLLELGYSMSEIEAYFKIHNRNKPVKQENTQDGKSKFAKSYHKYLKESPKWLDIKLTLYETRGKQCEVCGKTGLIDVHHRTYKNIFKEEPTDLILLCRGCHQKVHDK